MVAKDGAIFHGELVEKVPGQYVTVRLSTGEHRRILWSFVARITSRGQSADVAPQLRVRFNADDKRAKLQKLTAKQTWLDVCDTPCAGNVAATGVYRVTGPGLRSSEPFRLSPQGSGPVIIDAEVGTKGRSVLGAVLGIGGGVIAYVGGILILVSAIGSSQTDDGTTQELSYSDRRAFGTTGAVMFVGGGAAGIAGLLMLLNNDTKVTQSASMRAASSSPGREHLNIALPLGLSLTPRGFTF